MPVINVLISSIECNILLYLELSSIEGGLENVTYFHDISNHLLASEFQYGILL